MSELGKSAEAEAILREAIDAHPENGPAHSASADLLIHQHKYSDAEAAYRKSIRYLPDFVWAHNGLGWALSGQHKHAEAETAWREASPPGEPLFLDNLCRALNSQKSMPRLNPSAVK